jgi:hypothetical protein
MKGNRSEMTKRQVSELPGIVAPHGNPGTKNRIYKIVGSVKRNSFVGPGGWFILIRWPGSTTHLFDPAVRDHDGFF